MKQYIFLILFYCVGFCFDAFGNSQCEDIFDNSFSHFMRAKEKQELKQFESAYKEADSQFNMDADAIGRRLKQEYEKDPDHFLSLFRKKIREYEGEALRVIRYMKDPPLEIFHLIIELLETNLSGANVRYAYDVFMASEITDRSILQWLKSRMKKTETEGTLIRRVLDEQDRRKMEKLPRDQRPSVLWRS